MKDYISIGGVQLEDIPEKYPDLWIGGRLSWRAARPLWRRCLSASKEELLRQDFAARCLRREQILLALVEISVLAGSHAGGLFKLSHEMCPALVAAEKGKGVYGHIGGAQIVAGQADPGGNHVLFVGDAEKFFVQVEKMRDADACLCGKLRGAAHLERGVDEPGPDLV